MESSKALSGIIFLVLLVLCVTVRPGIGNLEVGTCPELLRSVSKSNPNSVCDSVECEYKFTSNDCPAGTIYIDNSSLCQCCPSCVKFRPLGGVCEPVLNTPADPECDTEGACVINLQSCLPGLLCELQTDKTYKCELPQSKPNDELEECLFRKSLRQHDLVHWDPECDADGGFKPKQCKGTVYDGECFCVDKLGRRIFGREWRNQAENQTCACSRQVFDLRSKGLTATLHCSSDGNYEALQCDTDSGVCYCVDPKTGKLDGAVLPESQWKSLPCFSVTLAGNYTDGKYLRKCESEYAGFHQITKVAAEHGLKLVDMKQIQCDFDGSFSPVQIVNDKNKCVRQNGTNYVQYFQQQRTDNMTCNCARDKYEYLPASNRTFGYDCEQNSGNFEIVYDFGSSSSCVDKDGYLYGDVVESKYYCCLMASGCSDELKEFCSYFSNKPGAYKSCYDFFYRT